LIQIILRNYDPNATLPNNAADCYPHHSVQALFVGSAILIIAGFVLLDVALIDSGQVAVGAVGIGFVSAIGIISAIVGGRTLN